MNYPEKYKREALFAPMVKYDLLAKPDDFIEVTHWYNGEGFDVCITADSGEERFSLTWGQYEALIALVPPCDEEI